MIDVSTTFDVNIFEVLLIVGGFSLTLCIRAKMKRIRAARMLSIWTYSIRRILEVYNEDKDVILTHFPTVPIPTDTYDGLVRSGLISHLGEKLQKRTNNLYQMVDMFNKGIGKEEKHREWRLRKILESVDQLHYNANHQKIADKWWILAKLFD